MTTTEYSFKKIFWKKLRRNKGAVFGLCIIVLAFLMAVFAYVVAPDSTPDANRIIAGTIFIVAALTDIADGTIARRWNLITNFGKIFDPIADKALIGVALIGLSYLDLLDWWFTWVILARELFVTFLRFWVINKGVIPASRGGKLKTITQIVAISFYLLPLPESFSIVGEIIMYAAVILTLATAVDYIMKAIMTDREEQ